MRKRPQSSSISPDKSADESSDTSKIDEETKFNSSIQIKSVRRSGFVWLTLFAVIAYSSWAVHHYQFEILPVPLTAEQAGKRGFSEVEAMKHVKALTELGPHPVGSDALDIALQVWSLNYFISFSANANRIDVLNLDYLPFTWYCYWIWFVKIGKSLSFPFDYSICLNKMYLWSFFFEYCDVDKN